MPEAVTSIDTAPTWLRIVVALDPATRIWFTHLPDCAALTFSEHPQESTFDGQVGQFLCPDCIDVNVLEFTATSTATRVPSQALDSQGRLRLQAAKPESEPDATTRTQRTPVADLAPSTMRVIEAPQQLNLDAALTARIYGQSHEPGLRELRGRCQPDPDQQAALFAATESWLRNLSVAVVEGHLTPDLVLVTELWIWFWESDRPFRFMNDMQAMVTAGKALSPGQVKGALNCWRSSLLQGRTWVADLEAA